MYCLWLNGKKIYTLQQLRASFDAEAAELYCLGGGLARWLKDCGEQDTAEKVEQIDLSKSISRQLAEIFGIDLPETEEQEYQAAITANPPIPAANGSFTPPYSSESSSFSTSSFALSNEYTSFFNTSFLTASFSGYEYEYEYKSSSFTSTSFYFFQSSFFAQSAFSAGSFALNSFTLGSFTTEYGSDSFHLGLSSFSPKSDETVPPTEREQPSLTPQQKFRLNLSSCPLNRYGYGIHLI